MSSEYMESNLTMPMFFISYKRDELEFAREIQDFIQNIEEKDYLAWIDRDGLSPGDNWKNAIDAAIKQSIGVIVIITPEAITSPYVTYEWSYAMGLGKRVIPLLLREPGSDEEPIHAKLNELHMLMFNSDNEAEHEWDALQKELESVTERYDVPPAIQHMKERMYENIFNKNQRQQIIETLQHFDHPAAREALAEFTEAGLPALSISAGIALAEKTNHTDIRAITGLIYSLREKSSGWSSIIKHIAKYNNDNAAQVLIDSYEKNLEHNNYTEVILEELGQVESSLVYQKMIIWLSHDFIHTTWMSDDFITRLVFRIIENGRKEALNCLNKAIILLAEKACNEAVMAAHLAAEVARVTVAIFEAIYLIVDKYPSSNHKQKLLIPFDEENDFYRVTFIKFFENLEREVISICGENYKNFLGIDLQHEKERLL